MKKKLLIVFISLACILLVITIGTTYAKYMSGASGTGAVSIAVPIITDDMETTIPLDLSDIKPGDRKEYLFNVTNYKDSKVNEVTMKYSITIKRSSNVPITIELFKNGGTDNVLNGLVSENNILGFTEKIDDSYKLVINWDINDNDYIYSDLPDYLDIEIVGVQVVN